MLKKSLLRFFTKWYALLSIIIIASLFRIILLDRIPAGVVQDELTYLLNAKAIFLTGTDITGTWNPLSIFIFHYPPGNIQAELPYFLFAPLLGIFPFSLFTAHLTNALFGIATVVVIYFLTKELYGESVAFIAGLVASVNPWMVYISRTAYEVVPAVFFYLLGIYVLYKTKKWKIFYSLPIFLLGFYSYIGMKIIFPLVIIATSIFSWYKNNKKNSIQYIFLCSAALLIVAIYFGFLALQPSSSRIGELFSFSDPKITQQVDAFRKSSLHSPLIGVFDNKLTIGLIVLVQKFFLAFSFSYLFLYGDSFFSLWHHGLFYYIDVVFLIAGMIGAFVNSKRNFLFIISTIIIGIIPQLAHSNDVNNFTPHIAFIFPFFCMLIGYGIWSIITSVKNHSTKKVIGVVIALLYIVMIGNFIQIYFFQSPIESGYFGFADRVAVQYVHLAASNNEKVYVYAYHPKTFFQRYLFYTNTTAVSYKKMQDALQFDQLSLGPVTINPCKNIDVNKVQGIVIMDALCGNKNSSPHLTVPQLIDGGEVYGIYNDKLCTPFVTRQFPSDLSLGDLTVESFAPETFCNTFITRY